MSVNGPSYIGDRRESLPVETHDVELHGNEFQRIFKWNDDTDRNPGIFNDMLLHDCLLPAPENVLAIPLFLAG